MNIHAVSYSSNNKLARCEKQYSYRYEEKLKKRTKKVGLFRGDWGHQLVESYYRGQDWKAKYDELVENQWDKIFDEEKEEYGLEFPEEIFELIEHYLEHWAPEHDNWEIISVESEHELPTKFGYGVRWKSDLIVKERDSGAICLIETKFKKSIPDSEERILQPQPHSYAYLHGKLGVKIDKVIWNYIRTEPVPRPKINKNGSLSIRKINTDQRGYLRSLKEAGIQANDSQEWEAIQKYVDSLPETLVLERITNSVNLEIGEFFVRQWIERANRAKAINHPLVNWNRNCKFDCDYYLLCQCDMRKGRDRDLVVKRDYLINISSVDHGKELK